MAEEVTNTADTAENVQQDAPVAEANKDEQVEAAATQEEAVEPVVTEIPVDEYAHLKPGLVVRVHLKIKDITPKGDERERIQVFEGTIIAVKGKDAKSRTMTVRKISDGIGVERIFPLKMPTIDKVEVVKEYRVRRAKLYFTRTSKKKLKEVKGSELIDAKTQTKKKKA
jgi:large subunit ribosomal protein L19